MSNTLHLSLENLREADYPQIKHLMDRVYDDLGGAWPAETLQKLIRDFPEGQIGLIDGETLVGIALTVQVEHKQFSSPHTYDDLIGKRLTIKHNPNGDVLYGLDLIIHPEYRGSRLGRRLYDARKELCRQLNLKGILAGGRITGYHLHADQMSAAEYLSAVRNREIYDPILSFQLSNDFQIKRLLKRYLPEDKKSLGYATLLEWDNILYDNADKILDTRKSNVRIGAVQWQMRTVASVEDVLSQVEYFIDTFSWYKSDFALFPEFFNAALMGLSEEKDQVHVIRYLADFTERFRDEILQMSVKYNINVITGSMPLLDQDELYNVSYLCRRDGTFEEQRKIHITPHEKKDWVMKGGNQLEVFETDAGRIGTLICYDIEFPELSRILADKKVDIIFVPFWTDTKNGYLRVRHCAQARAVENECYTVICGSCGNLPQVKSLDVQYAQSAVLSPSDFSFPHDAILAEATPNSEMILFADLDLDKLKILRKEGSVNNLIDRRHDLYKVTWTKT